MSTVDHEKLLQRLFDFTPEDIQCNHQGILSKRQETRILSSFRRTDRLLLLGLAAMMFCLFVPPLLITSNKTVLILYLIVISIILSLNAKKAVKFLKKYVDYRKNRKIGEILRIENVRYQDFWVYTIGNHRVYLLRIHGIEIEISQRQYDALDSQQTYQVVIWSHPNNFGHLLSVSGADQQE